MASTVETEQRLAKLHLQADQSLGEHQSTNELAMTVLPTSDQLLKQSAEDGRRSPRTASRPMAARPSRHSSHHVHHTTNHSTPDEQHEAQDADTESVSSAKTRRKRKRRRRTVRNGDARSPTAPGHNKLLPRRPPRLSSAPAKLASSPREEGRTVDQDVHGKESGSRGRQRQERTSGGGVTALASASASKLDVNNVAFSQWARSQMLLKYSGINRGLSVTSQPPPSDSVTLSSGPPGRESLSRTENRERADSGSNERDSMMWNKNTGNTSWLPQGHFPSSGRGTSQPRRLGEVRYRQDMPSYSSTPGSASELNGATKNLCQSKTFMFNPSFNILNAFRMSNMARSCSYTAPNRTANLPLFQDLLDDTPEEPVPRVCFSSSDRDHVRPILKSADPYRRGNLGKSVRFQLPEHGREFTHEIDL